MVGCLVLVESTKLLEFKALYSKLCHNREKSDPNCNKTLVDVHFPWTELLTRVRLCIPPLVNPIKPQVLY